MDDQQTLAKLLEAALDDIKCYRAALSTIANGEAMHGKVGYEHIDTVHEYQRIARKALK